YTPTGGGLVGSDHFTYTVSDGQATATGRVDLIPDNTPPPAAHDVTEPVAHATFGPVIFPAPGLLTGEPHTDADGDVLRPVLDTQQPDMQAKFGTVPIRDDGSFTYTPNDPTAPVRDDSFTYRLFDGYQTGPPATVHLLVPNTPPVVPDHDFTLVHG